MRNILLPLFITLFLFTFAQNTFGANASDILINEIAWMGTTTSGSDEWIELYNTTANPINLSGFMLASPDDKISISLKGEIPANEFYLLERTDDKSLPNIAANLIYKGSLSNTGIHLQLFNAAHVLIDEATFQSGWPKGDNTTKQTMERMLNKNWQTSKDAGGTPKAINSTGKIALAPKPKSTLPKTDKIDMSKEVTTKKVLQPLNKKIDYNPWILFITVALASSLLAAIIVVIKIKLTKLHERS